jgi:hypothetical protein
VEAEPAALAELGVVELALGLGRGAPNAALLDRAESLALAGQLPPELGLSLGRAFRLRGEPGSAHRGFGSAAACG